MNKKMVLIFTILAILIFTSGVYVRYCVDQSDTAEFVGFDLTEVEIFPQVIDNQSNFYSTGGKAYSVAGKELLKSTDGGETYTKIYEFDNPIYAIRMSPSNYLFVSTQHVYPYQESGVRGEIYRSNDYGETFTKVLSLQAAKVAYYWSFAFSKDGYVYIGEYGEKTKSNSSYVYRSSKNGDLGTWEICFNSTEYTYVTAPNHIHGVFVDPYTNDVYVGYGDKMGCIGNHRSTDRGDTWGENFEPTEGYLGAVFFKDYVIFLHEWDGIHQYWKANGTHRRIAHFGHNHADGYDIIEGKHGVIYACFFSNRAPDNVGVYASGDRGYTWVPIIFAENQTYGYYYFSQGIDRDGYIYVYPQGDNKIHRFRDITVEEWNLLRYLLGIEDACEMNKKAILWLRRYSWQKGSFLMRMGRMNLR